MKFTTATFFAIALIVGVGIGYMFNPSVEEPATAAKSEKAKGAIKDEGDAATIAALRARIAELEALLEKSGQVLEKVEKVSEDDRKNRPGPGGMSPKQWREKMKKENPERYAQMTNGMARWRAERLARAQKKVDFLASLDVSKMSASAKKVHSELQDMIAKREEVEQKMHEMHQGDEEPSREEMHKVFDEMREIDQQIRELNAQERDNLMVETAKNLGFSESEAGEVAEAFQEIIENTEGGFGSTGRPQGGPGGPGGNGGNPPPAPGN